MASKSDFLKALKSEMRRRNATQSEVANSAGLSQAHVSRLLSGALPLTGKSQAKLERWISITAEPALDDRLRVLLERVRRASPEHRKVVGSMLSAFEALLEA